MRMSITYGPNIVLTCVRTSCSEDLNIHGHFFSLVQLALEKLTCQGIFPRPSLCPCSWECRWRDSAWVWPQCTSLRLLNLTVSCGYQQSQDTHLDLYHKTRRQLRGEMHRWKMLYTSPELIGLHIWRTLLRVRIKDRGKGTTTQQPCWKVHHQVIRKGVRTGKLDDLFEFTEKVGDFQVWAEGQIQNH